MDYLGTGELLGLLVHRVRRVRRGTKVRKATDTLCIIKEHRSIHIPSDNCLYFMFHNFCKQPLSEI